MGVDGADEWGLGPRQGNGIKGRGQDARRGQDVDCECSRMRRPTVSQRDCGGSLRVSVKAAANQGDQGGLAGDLLGKEDRYRYL